MNVAASATMERKFLAVLSHRRATRLKCFLFPIICSMRARRRYSAFAKRAGIAFRFERYGMTGTAPRSRVIALLASLS